MTIKIVEVRRVGRHLVCRIQRTSGRFLVMFEGESGKHLNTLEE